MNEFLPYAELGDFAHPREILDYPGLSQARRRELLSAWACDAHTVPSRPAYRWAPGTPGPIAVAHILEALHALDRQQSGAGHTVPAFMIQPASASASRREPAVS